MREEEDLKIHDHYKSSFTIKGVPWSKAMLHRPPGDRAVIMGRRDSHKAAKSGWLVSPEVVPY